MQPEPPIIADAIDTHRRLRKWRPWRSVGVLLALLTLMAFAIVHPRRPGANSVCSGLPANGSLREAVSIPHHGVNFSSYSTLGWLLGRQHVHSTVYATLIDAQRELARSRPEVHTVFAESGWPFGGRLRPHRTHRNGTSVDIMVPVTRDGVPVPFPASLSNGFGYAVEFDRQGRYRDYRIDYDAMAAQLLALSRAARRNGTGIDVVIFDNTLQQQLWQAREGRKLQQAMRFSRTPAWVRHDEHYHVNFAVSCR